MLTFMRNQPPQERAFQPLVEIKAMLSAKGLRLGQGRDEAHRAARRQMLDSLKAWEANQAVLAAAREAAQKAEAAEVAAKAQEAHAATADRRSDFSWMLRAWTELETAAVGKSRRQLASFCRERFWSWRRAREWQAVHAQLEESARRLGLATSDEPASYRKLHTALLAGFAGRIGRRDLDRRVRHRHHRHLRDRLAPHGFCRRRAGRRTLLVLVDRVGGRRHFPVPRPLAVGAYGERV